MPDDLWSSFAAAGFSLWCPEPVTVRPAPPGCTTGLFPLPGPVAFLTADNPWGRPAPEADNVPRRLALADALDVLGLTWLPAVGGDPEGDHLEPGAAVLGLGIAAAVQLGARFDQAAVYLWTPQHLHLVACAGDRQDVLGYAASPGASTLVEPDLRRPRRAAGPR